MADQLKTIRQSYETSLRQVQALLTAEARLRAIAEEIADDTRAQMVRIAESLCPDWVDQARKSSPLGVDAVPPRGIADAVIRRALHAPQNAGGEAEATENVRLRQENALLKAKLKEAQAAPPATSAADDAHTANDERLPDWVIGWQAEPTHDRDLVLLRILAETGVPRWLDVVALFEEQAGNDLDTTTVLAQALASCQRFDLVEIVEIVEAETAGDQSYHLIFLTPTGRRICPLLLGIEPVPGHAAGLLERRNSPADVAMVLDAADLLRQSGFQVDTLPNPISLPDGRFTPDLVATLKGVSAIVMVESGIVTEDRPTRDAWLLDLHAASNGILHIITPDPETMDLIRSDAMFWISQHKHVGPTTLRMSNIAEVRSHKRKKFKGTDIWLFDRIYNTSEEE